MIRLWITSSVCYQLCHTFSECIPFHILNKLFGIIISSIFKDIQLQAWCKCFRTHFAGDNVTLVVDMIILFTVKWNTEFRGCLPRINSSIKTSSDKCLPEIWMLSLHFWNIKHNFHIPNKRKFWQLWSQVKCPIEAIYVEGCLVIFF